MTPFRAATIIQAVYRGYLIRKHMKKYLRANKKVCKGEETKQMYDEHLHGYNECDSIESFQRYNQKTTVMFTSQPSQLQHFLPYNS